MIVHVTDAQVVGETQATLFSIIQPSPINAAVIMSNNGVNTINYDFQQWNGTAWSDIGAAGTIYNNTLQPGQQVLVPLAVGYPQIQLLGNASGGALLVFSVTRYFSRTSGGPIPILNL